MPNSRKELFLWLSLGFGIGTLAAGGGAIVTYFGFTQNRTVDIEYTALTGLTQDEFTKLDDGIYDKFKKFKNDEEGIAEKEALIKPYIYDRTNKLSNYIPVSYVNPKSPEYQEGAPKPPILTRESQSSLNWGPENGKSWMKAPSEFFKEPHQYDVKDYASFIKVKITNVGVGLNNALEFDKISISSMYGKIGDKKPDAEIKKKYDDKEVWRIASNIFKKQIKKAATNGYRGIHGVVTDKDAGATFNNIKMQAHNYEESFTTADTLYNQMVSRKKFVQGAIADAGKALSDKGIKVNYKDDKYMEMLYNEIYKIIKKHPAEPLNTLYNNWGVYAGENDPDNPDAKNRVREEIKVLNVDVSKNIGESNNPIPPQNEDETKEWFISKSRDILKENKVYIDSQLQFMNEFNKTNTLFFVVIGLAGTAFICLFCVLTFFILYTNKKNKEEYGDTDEQDYLLV